MQTTCVLLQMLEKGGKLRVDILGVKILSSHILFAFLSVCQYTISVHRSG